MTSEPNVKGYAPIPQSMSNTDTEDEIEDHSFKNSDPKELQEQRTNGPSNVHNNGMFYPLDETKNTLNNRIRNGRISFDYSNDNIPIMILDGQLTNDDLWKRRDMTPLRRLCLVASVFLCIFTIILFLYILPCNNSVICSSIPEPQTSLSWDKTLEGVELHGHITIVPGNPNNLIFLLRGQQFGNTDNKSSQEKQQISPEGGGVLSMQSTDGTPLWWVKLNRQPTDIDCEMLDTDSSGKPDCLVSGEGGLLVSIEPTAGTIHWHCEVHTHQQLPLLFIDVNNDNTKDLLTIEINNTSLYLVLISGKSGQLLGRQIISDCKSVEINSITLDNKLSYICFKLHGNQERIQIPLDDFVQSLNFSPNQQKLILNASFSANMHLKQSSKNTWDLTPFHQLQVKNSDDCPEENCSSTVNLILKHGSNETHIWDYSSNGTFVSQPVILNMTGQNYTTGFALKFWHWMNTKNKTENSLISPDVQQHNFTVYVTLVLVNNTEVKEINPSQNEIIQLCKNSNCQPNLLRQDRSLIVADLNNDGIYEIISYCSTYNIFENTQTLTSKVQIVKLDAL